ncbi:hypothetical protein BP5796_03441 [Coleophoma crateriformis]|uniref:Uncharacterized protein n=1 Tax=Coleophoma crateriformis TaxID=565419 RepID=A0A3D8SN53_9HELO|nr:hypothetical protein BP5796_03441 [Coleophoma crateriformis]
MQFSIATTIFALLAVANAVAIEEPEMSAVRRDVLLLERQGVNANRPVPNGACCVANTSQKEDTCSVNGAAGKCVPANVNNCGTALTCIENTRLTCNANVLERGKPTCRLTPGA